MLLPLTFQMNPAGAIIMLAGIYYGAKYGGSTTSILMNVPGESASVVTCLDGYQMARKGRAGAALGIAAIASFVAGTVGVVGLMLVAPPIAKFALSFSSPEYFALMSLGLALVVLLAGRSIVKALLAALVGPTIASFRSYGLEKAVSPRRDQFGTGVIEGVAAPEGANNSETGGALVPLLTLGIPGSGTTAILLAALVLWGFKPGPLFIPDNPALFWGLVASMYIGNVMLLVLNLPLVPLFAQVLRLPVYVLYPLILGVSLVGVYSVSGSLFDLALLALFGLLGYLMRKLDYPSAPLILGPALGAGMERALP